MDAKLIVPYRYKPSYALTGTVYSSANVNIQRQGLFYKNVSGATEEIGLTITRDPVFGDPIMWIICSPSGVGMVGDIRVRFYRPAPPTYGAYTVLPRHTPPGLPDRRIFHAPWNIPTPDPSNQITLRIECAPDSEISRVIPVYSSDVLDISNSLQPSWKIGIEEIGKSASTSGDFIWETEQQTNPVRYRRFSATMNNLPISIFRDRGFHREIMIIPRWFDHTDDAEKLRLMYSTAVFGRFSKNYEARFMGVDSQWDTPVYTYPIEIKELI